VGGMGDHDAALEKLMAWLRDNGLDRDLHSAERRVVYRGSKHRDLQLITADLVEELDELVPIGAASLGLDLERQ
jgi:acetate kinase